MVTLGWGVLPWLLYRFSQSLPVLRAGVVPGQGRSFLLMFFISAPTMAARVLWLAVVLLGILGGDGNGIGGCWLWIHMWQNTGRQGMTNFLEPRCQLKSQGVRYYSVNLCGNEWDAFNDALTHIVCLSNKLHDICMHWWYSSEMIPVKP